MFGIIITATMLIPHCERIMVFNAKPVPMLGTVERNRESDEVALTRIRDTRKYFIKQRTDLMASNKKSKAEEIKSIDNLIKMCDMVLAELKRKLVKPDR